MKTVSPQSDSGTSRGYVMQQGRVIKALLTVRLSEVSGLFSEVVQRNRTRLAFVSNCQRVALLWGNIRQTMMQMEYLEIQQSLEIRNYYTGITAVKYIDNIAKY